MLHLAMASKKLDLDKFASVCECLDNLLKTSYGPNALHCMLSTSTGRLIITSSGHFILGSLHLSHPVARLVIDAVRAHHEVTGDNSKTFILLISETMRLISMRTSSSTCIADSYHRISLIRAFATLKTDILPFSIIPKLTDHYSNHAHNRVLTLEESRLLCSNIIRGSLQSTFNKKTQSHLCKISEELIFSNCKKAEDLQAIMHMIIDTFECLCVDSPGQVVLNTSIIDGVVIQRDFVGVTAPSKDLWTVKFILIDYPIDDFCPSEVETVIKIRTSEEGRDSLLWKSARLKRLVNNLSMKGIKVVLCSEVVSELFSFLLARKGIAIVQCVPMVDLERISSITRTSAVGDDNDMMDLDTFIGQANHVTSIIAGGKRMVLLKGLRGGSPDVGIKNTILLTAPTPGICDQVASSLLCAFKSVRMAFDQNLQSYISRSDGKTDCFVGNKYDGIVCPSGGSFEMSVSTQLEKLRRDKISDISVRNACNLLSESLLAVPHRLLENSFCRPGHKNRAHLLKFIASNTNHCDKCDAEFVSGLEGTWCYDAISDDHIVEPLSSKISLLYAVIDVLQQILKLDFIVPISRVYPKQQDTDDESE